MTRDNIAPQDRKGCRSAVRSASVASYRYLLGAFSLPCCHAALLLCRSVAGKAPIRNLWWAAEDVREALVALVERRALERVELVFLQSSHRLAVLLWI
ncbi:hypothetical protein NDU88_000796 [Pleurodeles waltl]|uniref:Uncharacterized protein n=1 Tax=Pleurodeles waltl TaxID=8319 RepID=A0AAV7S9P2_PLEWA|nr:hypothetical protein NDU88_000796 [Pleurodeles waltl]